MPNCPKCEQLPCECEIHRELVDFTKWEASYSLQTNSRPMPGDDVVIDLCLQPLKTCLPK